MNTIKSMALLILSFTASITYSQEYKQYVIEGVGNISIPGNMELQDGEYKKFSDGRNKDILKKTGLTQRAAFQQKGLNEAESAGFATYVRIIIDTESGKFDKLSEELSIREIQELDNVFLEGTKRSFYGSGIKLVKWLGTEKVKVNNQNAIRYEYIRQLEQHPYVHVTYYLFQNNDRLHTISTSYWIKDKEKWKPSLDKAVNSFKITNIR